MVALVFGRSLGFQFTSYDDPTYVTSNPHIADGLTLRSLQWALGSGYAGNWHPVTWISHMLDIELFGLSPWGHHLTNVLLHGIAVLLLFHILHRQTKRLWLSFIATALFAIHPLRAESVAWVAERKDVLSACFALASVLLYCLYTESKDDRRVRYGASLFFFALAIASKPMFVTLPALLILFDYWPLQRKSTSKPDRKEPSEKKPPPAPQTEARTSRSPSGRKHLARRSNVEVSWVLARAWEKAPFFGISALCAWITVLVQSGGGTMQAAATIPLLSRATNALVSYAWYLWKMLVPDDLTPLYLHPAVPGGKPWAFWQILLATITLIAITITVWRTRRRGYPVFGWLWYLIALLPVIGIIQVGGQAAADRYTYSPMIGICVAVVWALADVISWASARSHGLTVRRAIAPIACVSILVYGTLAWAQVGRWRDSETLYRHGLAVDPDNMLFHNNLGLILRARGDLTDAARHFEEALRIHPLYRQAMESLADIATDQGRHDDAERYLRQALALRPGEGSGEQVDLGRVRILLELADLLANERPEEAAGHYREAARLQPGLARFELEQARSLARAGKVEEARAHFERASSLDPTDVDAAHELGTLLAASGDFEESARALERVVAIDPKKPEARNDLGYVLLRAGRSREAIAHLEAALELRPGWTLPAQTLAWIVSTDPDPGLRNPSRAINLMEQALRTNANDTGLLGTLAAAQAASGDVEAALRTVRQAIRISIETNDSQTERLRQQEALYLSKLGVTEP
jgi:tetratricopeptide (TPR) repeat protein